jgi:hypothetical protein
VPRIPGLKHALARARRKAEAALAAAHRRRGRRDPPVDARRVIEEMPERDRSGVPAAQLIAILIRTSGGSDEAYTTRDYYRDEVGPLGDQGPTRELGDIEEWPENRDLDWEQFEPLDQGAPLLQ